MSGEILHQSEGLKIVRNEVNQFVVCTLHHTADPAKRSKEWVREAKAGMTPEQAAREYDIDYRAVQGSKVFPEMSSRQAEIILHSPYPVLEGGGLRFWGGFDYGARNPSSFHVYTVKDEVTYSVWELYEPCRNIEEYAKKMLDCPYWDQIRYVAADPKCWARDQQQAGGQVISIADMFFKQGVRKLVRGRNDPAAEEAWIQLLRAAWQGEEPTFKIFDRCPEQIRELERAIYVPQSERQLLGSVYCEAINDRDNHSLDDCKYFMLSRPKVQARQRWEDPIMVNRWGAGKASNQVSRSPSGGPKGYL